MSERSAAISRGFFEAAPQKGHTKVRSQSVFHMIHRDACNLDLLYRKNAVEKNAFDIARYWFENALRGNETLAKKWTKSNHGPSRLPNSIVYSWLKKRA